MRSKPKVDEYASSFAGYVDLVLEQDVFAVLDAQLRELEAIAVSLPASRERYRYGPGKWSIREVFGHLVDAERVFGYRAFCISRGEAVSLPAFDENAYVKQSSYDDRPLQDLFSEFQLVRKGNIAFLRVLDDPAWERLGKANERPVSVRALAFIIAGHARHHLNGLRERYGVSAQAGT